VREKFFFQGAHINHTSGSHLCVILSPWKETRVPDLARQYKGGYMFSKDLLEWGFKEWKVQGDKINIFLI